jgi:hypothetical protein
MGMIPQNKIEHPKLKKEDKEKVKGKKFGPTENKIKP